MGTHRTRRTAEQNSGVVSNMKKTNTTREPARIRQVQVLNGYNVELLFADGARKRVNLKKYLHGPAFEQARTDMQYFRQVFIDPVGETIMWPNTADIDADVLRHNLRTAWQEKKLEQARARKSGKRKTVTESLVAKRIYLYPRQVKQLAKINANLSAAIRQVIDTL